MSILIAVGSGLGTLQMIGLLRGAVLYGLCRWWLARRAARALERTQEQAVTWTEVEIFERSGVKMQLAVVSRARHWVAVLFAAIGPFAWPVLAWRYGARAAFLWCFPVFLVHMAAVRMVMENMDMLFVLGLVMPMVYCLLAFRMASRDHQRRVIAMVRNGWCSQGRRKQALS